MVEQTLDYLDDLDSAPVGCSVSHDDTRAAFGRPLAMDPEDPGAVIADLIAAARPGLTLMPSGRFFGFVIGGTLPAALAADWLTSAWDQNAGLYAPTPAAAVAEEVAGEWLKDLFGVPVHASFALVTGAQMAHVTCLAAARHHVLQAVGWDVEVMGLGGAPRVRVLVGAQRHVTVNRALRFLGMGSGCMEAVDVDDQGRMVPASLAATLQRGGGPAIVCAQVGEVNTGAIDDVAAVSTIAHDAGAWLHVDGAFGLWASASPVLRPLVAGVKNADSWATDCHKWLNVPYDCGVALCAHPDAHRAAMTVRADYLEQSLPDGPRDPVDWTPEFSRRARAFAVYAALRSLGRAGVASLIETGCAHARRFADLLRAAPGVEVVNEVTLNQVLVRFAHPRGGDDDAHTRGVVARVQRDGVCWMSGTTWRGTAAMRISVSSWRTTTDDVDRSAAAILRAAATTA